MGTVAAILGEAAGPENKIEQVSLEEWVETLRRSISGTQDVAQNPVIHLIDFYQDLAVKNSSVSLDTTASVTASESSRKLGAYPTGLDRGIG